MLDGIRNRRPPASPVPSVTSTATSAISRSPQRNALRDPRIESPGIPNSTWMPGDWMSASMTPTRLPDAASSAATFAVVFDFPVPPRKLWTEMIVATSGVLGRDRRGEHGSDELGHLDRLGEVRVHAGLHAAHA